MGGIGIEGGQSGNVAEVTDNKELKVRPTMIMDDAGLVVLACESHDGVTGAARLVRTPESDGDWRLRTGEDSLLFDEIFPGTVLNTSVWQAPVTTMTIVQGAGVVALNSGNSVAAAAVSRLQSWRSFSLFQASTLYVECTTIHTAALPANCVEEWGLMICTGVAAPTDGIFFRLMGSGQFLGVCISGGVEINVDLAAWVVGDEDTPVPQANQRDHWTIEADPDEVAFWKNDQLMGIISLPSNGLATASQNKLPYVHRLYNAAAVTTAVQVRIIGVTLSMSGYSLGRTFATMLAGMGLGAYQHPTGRGVVGQTANWANSTAPAAAVLSNTAASYTTLGGLFQFTTLAGAVTDYALFGFQVPLGTKDLPGRNLIIRNINISTVNSGAAIATTPAILLWALGIGASAVSLATAEAATTKAPRRIPLGIQSFVVGDLVGRKADNVFVDFDAAITVSPGEFVHIVLRLPTATAGAVLTGTVFINGIWE